MLYLRWLISIIGLILFFIDVYMSYIVIKTSMKYIELMVDVDDESQRKKLRIYPYFFAVLMILRGVSENVFRTGSELVYIFLQDGMINI